MNVSIKTWLANTVRYTTNAYCFVDTLLHALTKWPEAQPLTSKSAEGVVHFLLSLITRFGCFKSAYLTKGGNL